MILIHGCSYCQGKNMSHSLSKGVLEIWIFSICCPCFCLQQKQWNDRNVIWFVDWTHRINDTFAAQRNCSIIMHRTSFIFSLQVLSCLSLDWESLLSVNKMQTRFNLQLLCFADNCAQPAMENGCVFLLFWTVGAPLLHDWIWQGRFTLLSRSALSSSLWLFNQCNTVCTEPEGSFVICDHLSATQISLVSHKAVTRHDHYVALFSWPDSQHNSC